MAFELQPRLEGRLLDLRPLETGDWDEMFALASDPAIWVLHPHNDRYQEAVFRTLFEQSLASGGALVAIDRATGRAAGWSRYSAQGVPSDEIEIGWTFLARVYWGGDYNADMKASMLAHAFRFVDRVIFCIGEGNLRSRRAIEKLGARLTDRREMRIARGEPVPHVIYAISRG